MKVCVLSGVSRNEGGLFYSVRWLSQALQRLDVNIRLVSHIDGDTDADLPLWHPIPTDLYHGYGPLLGSVKLRRILRSSNADLLHVHGLWLDRQWAAAQWQARTRRPVVISPRGMLDPWAVKNSAWKKKLVGMLFANESLRKASCIHALCASEAESIRAYGLRNPIALIPNGVDLPRLDESPRRTGNKKLLFLGRIHPKKGLKELIEAWSRWRHCKDGSDWHLLIAGWDDGGYEAGLKQLASQQGVGESVVFVGPQFGDEKDRLLRSVDAFILPSFSEGLPMSVLEAWSYSLPVVMTDYCNIPRGFEAAAAIRTRPEVDSIVDALARIGDMPADDLAEIGARGRQLVEQEFTWERIAYEMRSVYEWCLGGHKPACILDA